MIDALPVLRKARLAFSPWPFKMGALDDANRSTSAVTKKRMALLREVEDILGA